MYNQYVEILVKRKQIKGMEKIKFFSKILVLALLLLSVSFSNLLLIFFTVLIGLILFIMTLEIEYEYYYFNAELEIARIFNKSRRRNVICLKESMIDMIAPADLEELKFFTTSKVIDCSAADVTHPPYAIICHHDNKLKKVLIQMNEELLDVMRKEMPGKIEKERMRNESV